MKRSLLALLLCLLAYAACATPGRSGYPAYWWDDHEVRKQPEIPIEYSPDKKFSWEIMPSEAGAGEVILSKRNELGLLSNFAATPFEYRGKKYASVEGFWQMMLYPENSKDPRARIPGAKWPHTREQVAAMTALDAKTAGDEAFKILQPAGIDWVSFEGKRFPYHSATHGEHYRLIREAMQAKLEQNPRVKETLLRTGSLRLKPDHHGEEGAPDEWKYYELWEQLRAELQAKTPL